MDKLLRVISDLASNTPPERIKQLANLVRGFTGSSSSDNLISWALTPKVKESLVELTTYWRSSEISSEELAGMLLGASHAYRHAKSESETELVWTGPSSDLIATRKTEQALLEVINTANKKLFLTSLVAYHVDSLMTALTTVSERGVGISMLLESSDAHGGGISTDIIGQMKKVLPTAKIYSWGEKAEAFVGGKVHAKVAVSDERICFISSANLTGHAMEKNMEAGVLIKGGAIPRKLHKHLESLVTTKVLKRA